MSHKHHFRDHFRSLLSRHATFHASVTIHELTNIPLRGGQFAVRWRFHNALHHGESSAQQSLRSNLHDAATKMLEQNTDLSESLVSSHQTLSKATQSSTSSSDSSSVMTRERDDFHEDIGVVTRDTSFSKSSGTSPEAEQTRFPRFGDDESLDPDSVAKSSKGRTNWVDLRGDHVVEFDQHLDIDVQFTIDRESKELESSELKLEIHQIHSGVKQLDKKDAALGVVYIDLTEYVGAGKVTRRHLLRKSKVNSILRVSVELEQISGETDFRINNFSSDEQFLIGGFLERAEPSMRIESDRISSKTDSRVSTRPPSRSGRAHSFSKTSNHPGAILRPSNLTDPRSVPTSMPSASTEAIINALFNPFPSASAPTPFTYASDPSLSAGDHLPPRDSQEQRRVLVRGNTTLSFSSSKEQGSKDSRPPRATNGSSTRLEVGQSDDNVSVKSKKSSPGKWWKMRPTPSRANSIKEKSDHEDPQSQNGQRHTLKSILTGNSSHASLAVASQPKMTSPPKRPRRNSIHSPTRDSAPRTTRLTASHQERKGSRGSRDEHADSGADLPGYATEGGHPSKEGSKRTTLLRRQGRMKDLSVSVSKTKETTERRSEERRYVEEATTITRATSTTHRRSPSHTPTQFNQDAAHYFQIPSPHAHRTLKKKPPFAPAIAIHAARDE